MGKFINVEKVQDLVVIKFIFNEINLDQREKLKKELNELLGKGDARFIIDLSKVGFLSSLVIATIVFFAKEVRKADGDVKLCALSSEAFSIFRITQLDKVFELYDTETAAVESFKKTV